MSKYEPTGNYYRISHAIIEDQRFRSFSQSSKILYIYLAKYRNRYNRKPYFVKSNKQLSQDTGLSIRSIASAKKELKKSMLVWMSHAPGGRTKYQLYEPTIHDITD